jgi:hypothetical protein
VIALAAGCAMLAAEQRSPLVLMPVADVKPGMVGVGRTIFAGDRLEDFKVEIIGTLDNIIGPGRQLILAKLSGGPLAETGVIAGMSGSPVYIDGKLVGAVSYALGSFPKEPLAGITPIGEMLSDVDKPINNTRPERAASSDLGLKWPAEPADVFSALHRFAARAASPLNAGNRTLGPLDLSLLRPIGAAFSIRGFDATIGSDIGAAFGVNNPAASSAAHSEIDDSSAAIVQSAATLRPGDAVGTSIMRGDMEMGATGTVTHVDGSRVYAFGHPFLALGPTQMSMTKARVMTVLPSLQSSMKIAVLGPVIGSMTQDRATAIGGTLGTVLPDLAVSLTLNAGAAPPRRFNFHVSHDPALTPLFAYVAMLNVLTSYQRQTGSMTVGISGSASFGQAGRITVDDLFSGDNAHVGAANTILQPLVAMMNNEWRMSPPDTLNLTLTANESQGGLTIDRAWLDTSRPQFGATHTLHVLLRNFRGQTETRSMPVTMPTSGPGALTLVVSDAPTLQSLEQKELDPSAPKSIAQLVADLNATRRNNRLYVRLLASTPGSVIAGKAQPALPGSTRSVLDLDKSSTSSVVTRTVVGSWEERFDKVIRGSRELTLTLRAAEK